MSALTMTGRIGNKLWTRFVIFGTTDPNTIPVNPALPKGILRTDTVGTLTTRKIRFEFASAKLVLVLLMFTNRNGRSVFMRAPSPHRRPESFRSVRYPAATTTPRHYLTPAQTLQ